MFSYLYDTYWKKKPTKSVLVKCWATMSCKNSISAPWHWLTKSLKLYWTDVHHSLETYCIPSFGGFMWISNTSVQNLQQMFTWFESWWLWKPKHMVYILYWTISCFFYLYECFSADIASCVVQMRSEHQREPSYELFQIQWVSAILLLPHPYNQPQPGYLKGKNQIWKSGEKYPTSNVDCPYNRLWGRLSIPTDS